MSLSRPSSPQDLLLRWLAERPRQSRCEWVIDTDRLVDWRAPQVVDKTGRAWHRVLYTGDDLAFRWAYRRVLAEAEDAGQPLLLVVARGTENPGAIDISYITDILGRAEGEPLDLSVVAFFKSIFPKVNPPQDALRRYRTAFVENAGGLRKAYDEFKHRWGEPDDWSRGQFFAVLLMARHPDLRLSEVYCDDPAVVDCLVHICRLITHPALTAEDYGLVWSTVRESLRVRSEDVDAWLDVDPADMAGYLVLRDFAEGQGLQNPAAQIMGKYALRVDVEAMERYALGVVAALRRDVRIWEQVNRHAAVFFRDHSSSKMIDLVGADANALAKTALSEDTSPVFVRDILMRILREYLQDPQPNRLEWAVGARQHRVLRGEGPIGIEIEAAHLLRSLVCVYSVESRLAASVPAFGSPEELLDWYLRNGIHFLELDVSDAYEGLEGVADRGMRENADAYFLHPSGGLKRRVRSYLDKIDEQLASLIAADARGFALGPRSAVRVVSDTVAQHAPGPKGGRTWILVFDGMRFDTWERVVRPLLMEHFEVVEDKESAYFCVLPSRTAEARRSLLAGCPPNDWLGPSGKPTRDERLLLGRRLGLTSQEIDLVRLVTEAQTTQRRRRLEAQDADAVAVNVLIYPISDELAHFQGDSLSRLNARIRREMTGDKEQNLRGILDDLLMRVTPGDVVLVSSDHGFIELLPDQAVDFGEAEVQAAGEELETAVQYRVLRNYHREGLQPTVEVQWDARARYVLPAGGLWFRREKGRATRYAHGGVSMAEMVVPGVLVRRITEKLSRVEFEGLPDTLEVGEDGLAVFNFSLVNVGNTEVDVDVSAVTNLGEPALSERCHLKPGGRRELRCEFVGHYAADSRREVIDEKTTKSVLICMKHSDPSGQLREPANGRAMVAVCVWPKAAKIETEALKGFDDV